MRKFDLLSMSSLRFFCDHFYQIMYSSLLAISTSFSRHFAVVDQDEVLGLVLNNVVMLNYGRCVLIYRVIFSCC